MRLPLRLAAVLAFAASAAASRADTYRLYDLGSDEVGIYGLDNNGDVTTTRSDFRNCGPNDTCYYNYKYGQLQSVTFSPTIATDNGTRCSAPIATTLFDPFMEVCNNDRVAVVAFNRALDPNIYGLPFLYPDALNPTVSLYASANTSFLLMDSRGDVVYNDASREELYFAVDLTTAPAPEPSSIALLGTGLLGIGAAARRRLRA